jgi:hypothetical protein
MISEANLYIETPLQKDNNLMGISASPSNCVGDNEADGDMPVSTPKIHRLGPDYFNIFRTLVVTICTTHFNIKGNIFSFHTVLRTANKYLP